MWKQELNAMTPDTLLAKAAVHEECAERITRSQRRADGSLRTMLSVEALDQYQRAEALRERARALQGIGI